MTIGIFCENDITVYNNDLFKDTNDLINEYYFLKIKLERLGHTVNTLDYYKDDVNSPNLIFVLDYPVNQIRMLKLFNSILVLVVREPKNINKYNHLIDYHKDFNYVLTWNKSNITQFNYFLIPSTKKYTLDVIVTKHHKKENSIVMVNSNKYSTEKNNGYDYRKKVLNYYKKNNSNILDLYGFDWDRINLYFFGRKFPFYLNTRKYVKMYRGILTSDKVDLIANYKYSIVIENTFDTNDYISEKIFDVFLANSVPIYLGPPNINDYIPSNCFINLRSFDSFAELDYYLNLITDLEYNNFLICIKAFLTSSSSLSFTYENWSRPFCHIVKNEE